MTAIASAQFIDLDGIQATPVPSTSSSNAAASLFTCLSCSIGYPNPEDQRAHYRTDLHRYNMKRRVANLPPVRADVFNEKLLERKSDGSEVKESHSNHSRCQACQKSFASLNAFQSHLNSKRHKETMSLQLQEEKQAHSSIGIVSADPLKVVLERPSALEDISDLQASLPTDKITGKEEARANLRVAEDATEEDIQAAIDAKVASSRRIDPETSCLFCSSTSFTSLDDSVEHMSRQHGFFLPEQDYLTDRLGLMKYLSDKICVGNMCLYCNGRGRGFATGEAARKHMIDKSHCKVAYEAEEDKLEFSDFYDFTSSYPEAQWEDVSDDEGDAEDAVTEEDESDGEDDKDLADASNQVRYGDNEFELVLPSGVRLGHRSLRRYYNQSLRPTGSAYTNGTSGREVAHRLNASRQEKKDSLMVENRGGHMVKARNRGEAREAKKHINTYRDMTKREQFKTQIGYRNNSQKYFRDPLLQ